MVNQAGCVTSSCRSVTAVAVVIDNPKGLPRVKESISSEINFDAVLSEKCSNSSFLPRTPSASQHAWRMIFHCAVLLGRAAIFGYKEMTVFIIVRGRVAPVWRKRWT